MTDLRTTLSDQPIRQKRMGLVLMLVGIAGFFAAMFYFGLFGTAIQYSGIGLAEEVFAFAFLLLGLFGFGYALGGRRRGLAFATGWTILVVTAALIGLARRSIGR